MPYKKSEAINIGNSELKASCSCNYLQHRYMVEVFREFGIELYLRQAKSAN